MSQEQQMSETSSSADLDDSVLAISHEGGRHHETTTNRANYSKVIIDTGAKNQLLVSSQNSQIHQNT